MSNVMAALGYWGKTAHWHL